MRLGKGKRGEEKTTKTHGGMGISWKGDGRMKTVFNAHELRGGSVGSRVVEEFRGGGVKAFQNQWLL